MSTARKLRRAKARQRPRGPVHHVATFCTGRMGMPIVEVDGVPVDQALICEAMTNGVGRLELPGGTTLSFGPVVAEYATISLVSNPEVPA